MSNAQEAFDLPLTIGVISDTHIYPRGSQQLPPGVRNLFTRAGVGLILHLGDVNHPGVLRDLALIAPVLAVQGNNDSPELLDSLPLQRTLSVGPITIGMVHGHGGRSARAHAIDVFAGAVDLACFGHSHKPGIEDVAGTIMLNPGSATDRRWHPHFGVAIVHITAAGIDPELILFTDPHHLDNIAFERNHESPEESSA